MLYLLEEEIFFDNAGFIENLDIDVLVHQSDEVFMVELKPCPFCGSPAELTGECDMIWGRCSNENCQAELIGKFDEPEDAIEDWNNRA